MTNKEESVSTEAKLEAEDSSVMEIDSETPNIFEQNCKNHSCVSFIINPYSWNSSEEVRET